VKWLLRCGKAGVLEQQRDRALPLLSGFAGGSELYDLRSPLMARPDLVDGVYAARLTDEAQCWAVQLHRMTAVRSDPSAKRSRGEPII
jgi:hypothetical protein